MVRTDFIQKYKTVENYIVNFYIKGKMLLLSSFDNFFCCAPVQKDRNLHEGQKPREKKLQNYTKISKMLLIFLFYQIINKKTESHKVNLDWMLNELRQRQTLTLLSLKVRFMIMIWVTICLIPHRKAFDRFLFYLLQMCLMSQRSLKQGLN